MNVQDECIKIHSKFGMSEMANYKIQLLFDSEIEKVKKEYEEKIRWIPVEEELPTIHVDVILKCESGFWDKGCLIHQSGDNMFSSSSGDLDIVTHWRLIS